MEIQLSLSSVRPKTYAMSAADTEAIAQELLPKLQRLAKGGVSAAELEAHATELVSKWVKSVKTQFSPEARSKSASRIVTKMLAAFKKSKGSPTRKSLADTVDALISGNKLAAPLLPTIRRLNDLAIGPVAEIKAAGFSSKKDAQSKVDKLVGLLGAKGKKAPAGFSAPNGTDAKAKKLTKAEITEIAERLVYEVKFKGKVDSKAKDDAINRIIGSWTGNHSVKYPNATRLLNQSLVSKKLVELVNKAAGATSEKAPASAPADKVVPTTKAATKEEKQKAQILAATKLRNQFAGMLTKAPAMTGKSIENIRKHCVAYNRVITSVQKGNEALAETTKIEGLRGIDSVKNYVNNVLGLTYGYVEIAKQLGVAQTALKDKISAGITVELSNADLKRTAKANSHRALDAIAKVFNRRNCTMPTAFARDVEKVFIDAAVSGDYKKAKELLRDRIDLLVADVFRNKTKLHSAK